MTYTRQRRAKERLGERRWQRYVLLYNRAEAAMRRHIEAKERSGFSDEHDDALAAAYRSIVRDSAVLDVDHDATEVQPGGPPTAS